MTIKYSRACTLLIEKDNPKSESELIIENSQRKRNLFLVIHAPTCCTITSRIVWKICGIGIINGS